MKKSANLIIVLTTTAIISGIILAFLNNVTQPRIEAHAAEVLKNAVSDVLPGIETYDTKVEKFFINSEDSIVLGTKPGEDFKEEEETYFLGKDVNGTVQNVAFQAIGNGFQSKLKILVGMDLEMKNILSIKILEQMETPGLGTKIETDPSDKENPGWFYKQFAGIQLSSKEITYVKNEPVKDENKAGAQIVAITGATISSVAVVDIINDAIAKNRKIFLKQG